MVVAQHTAIRPPEIEPLRFRCGMVLFALWLPPGALIAPLVVGHLPLSTIATVTAGVVIAQHLAVVGAIAILGKPGFLYLKKMALGHLREHLAPAHAVGVVRHRIGLVMLCVPFLLDLIESYASHIVPDIVVNRLWVDVGADLLLVASLFVLGGNFWDKLHALFIREATACSPPNAVVKRK
jgi:hypothetical protein